MALDGIFLHFLKQEIEREALGARVEKVSQPSREELVLSPAQPGGRPLPYRGLEAAAQRALQ